MFVKQMMPNHMSLRPAAAVAPVRAPARLAAVLATRPTGAGAEPVAERILGILQLDPDTLFNLRGLARMLQLCQVGGQLAAFLRCNEVGAWRELYRLADKRIVDVGRELKRVLERARLVLVSFDDAQRHVASADMTDRQAANYYKSLLVKHVVYFSLYESYYFQAQHQPDASFDLVWFQSQVQTFLGRSNGSMPAIVKEIRAVMKRTRERVEFPPVPADFFVAAIRIVAEVSDRGDGRRFYQKGRPRLPALEAYIMNSADDGFF